jgi:hypothetical protein
VPRSTSGYSTTCTEREARRQLGQAETEFIR